ncbi:MAG: 16S rRNA (guanine(966)-N(2))-methyltransferase RsmD [Candidatus Kapabacteria bacterium]|nr:16S rRNA (guanine(966)-N(2))-methyltransferase RsmD [Candidatus Kapabacteria bacterium]
MRIISGKFGGRRFDIKVPPETRPTTDFVKEIVFNVLQNIIDFEGKIVYDLFAGTGAYGFEALSRGAYFCCFVDKSPKACEIIKNISEKLGLEGKNYSIIKKDVLNFVRRHSESGLEKPDIIFIDAPYEKKIENNLLNFIKENKIYKNEGLIIIEHSKMINIMPLQGFEFINKKEAGDSIIDFIRCNL